MNSSVLSLRKECPACLSTNFKIIKEIPYSNTHIRNYLKAFYNIKELELQGLHDACYSVAECLTCRLIFQLQIPDADFSQTLYENWISPLAAFKTKVIEQDISFYIRYTQEILNIIQQFNAPPSTLDILDFGMGWGRWCLLTKALGCNSVGTELSQERVKYARSNGLEVITWEDIALRKFDFVNTEQVFEHVPNPLETLKYLSHSLKPGGIIKISVPNGRNIHRALAKMDWSIPKKHPLSLSPIAPLEHVNCFTRKSILTMGNILNLTPIKPCQEIILTRFTPKRDVMSSLKDLKRCIAPFLEKYLRHKNLPETYIFLQNKSLT